MENVLYLQPAENTLLNLENVISSRAPGTAGSIKRKPRVSLTKTTPKGIF
jgi:hypothetical protein